MHPALVRPVAEEPSEEDWIVGGLDIRDVRSWEIEEVCADA